MSRTSTFTARPGGVATREVGTITGRVELETSERDGQVSSRVRYEGADEWYHLAEEPTIGSAEAVHEALVGVLSGPEQATGPDEAAHGEGRGRDAADPAAGSFGGARS